MNDTMDNKEIEILKKYVDASGVNVRFVDPDGNVRFINLPIGLDEGDRWKDKLQEMVAREQAKIEHHRQKEEMDMAVTEIEDKNVKNEKIDVTDRVEQRKKDIEKGPTDRPVRPSKPIDQ